MQSFAASVEGWSERALRNSEAIFKQSAQEVIADAQLPVGRGGRMRVDTGFLRNSHVSGLNGQFGATGADSYTLTIATSSLGDTITGGWTANYAVHREFGARGQAPDFFLRGAAQKWPQIVTANANKVTFGQ